MTAAEADDTGASRIGAAIADHLGQNGYRVARHVSLRGRSGATHVVDVLAEKTDAVTTFRVMVHCGTWDTNVDRDVLGAIHLIATDLGVGKIIVVTARGFRSDAEATARRLGMDLWGPVELEQHVGPIDQPAPRQRRRESRGFPVTASEQQARELVHRGSRGVLGLGREEVAWLRPVWLPFLPMRVRHTREEKDRFRKPFLRTREYHCVYDGLSGALYEQWDRDPRLVSITQGRIVRARITPHAVVEQIEDVAARLNSEQEPEEVEQLEESLLGLGIPSPVSFFDIQPEEEIYVPFYLALLRNRSGERILAINAHLKTSSESMGRIAMMHLSHIVRSAE